MNKRRVIVWFRNDLRLHDHEALQEAISSSEDIYPIYIFDERTFLKNTKFGFRKTGLHRARFIIEAVENLRKGLQSIGSDLIVRVGKPETVIFDLAKELKTSWVFCNRERTYEEVRVQDRLESNLWSIGQEVRFSRGKMLYYTADLPFPVTHTPEVFTHFRKEVEKIVQVRKPFAPPEHLAPPEIEIEFGVIPSLSDFNFTDKEIEQLPESYLKGGEEAGLNRLNYYLWESDLVNSYKETRNGLVGRDYSSKFSAYLAHGCLSPKQIFHQLKEYEEKRGSNESTYHLFFELLWRDFFRLMGKKHGNSIFQKGGIKESARTDLTDDMALFRIWSEGRTGLPFVDAAMRELNRTGYMSNRARQNTASFLVNDLHINWQIGAEYFESKLIDYDPCSNWGNWNYIAGIGNDPREGRHFNILSQAKKYDPNGDFVKEWIPELNALPPDKIHEPYLMCEEDQRTYNCILPKHYPQLVIKKDHFH